MNVTIYYGSRRAQPERAREFIEFAVERLRDNSDYVLMDSELAALDNTVTVSTSHSVFR